MKGCRLARVRRFRALHFKIDHNRILPAADHHSFARFIGFRVNFLMRNEGWNVDEIARSRFAGEFEGVAPAHTSAPLNNVENGFELAMVMRAGFSVGLNHHRARPEFGRAGARVGDSGGASHASRLRRVGIELVRMHNLYAVDRPIHRLNYFFTPKLRVKPLMIRSDIVPKGWSVVT